MANDGQIVFEVTADGKHAIADIKEITRAIQTETKNWDKAAEQSTTNIGNNFSSMLKKLVAGFSAVKIGKELLQFGKDALEAASDLKEVQNVVDVTFGDNANQIEKWAKNAGDQFGLTETQAKKFSSTMGAMLKSAGLAGDQIVDVSTDLAGLAADMASFYNLDFEEAFAKIRSGISGQTMPLKELGIDLSVATLNAFALQKGLTKTYDKMSQGEQTMLRYQYLMQATADAQGDFSRTSDEYANSMRKLETNINRIKTALGNSFYNAVTDASNWLNGFLETLLPDESAPNVLDEFAKIDLKTQDKLDEIALIKKEAEDTAAILEKLYGNTEDDEQGKAAADYISQFGAKSEQTIEYLKALGFSEDEIAAKGEDWLEICKRLVKTLPGLNSIINTETGEVNGGKKAIDDYIIAWEAGQKKLALLKAQEQRRQAIRNQYDELPLLEVNKLLFDDRLSKAKEQLQRYYKELGVTAESAAKWFNGKEFGHIGYIQAEELKLTDEQREFLNNEFAYYNTLKANADEATKKLETTTDAMQKALDIVDQGDAAIEKEYGAIEKIDILTQEWSADTKDAAKTAVEAVRETLTNLNDYVQGVRDGIKGTLDGIVKGFNKVDYSTYTKAKENIDKIKKGLEGLKEGSDAWEKQHKELEKYNDQLITTSTLTKNLESQRQFLSDYLSNLEKAQQMGLNHKLLSELSDGSVESAQYLDALVNGNETGISVSYINTLYEDVQKKKEQLTGSLTESQLSVDEVYKQMVADVKAAFESMNAIPGAAGATAEEIVDSIAEGINQNVGEVASAVDSIIKQLERLTALGFNSSIVFGAIPGFATGLSYVPRDNFLARLHEGEGILNAEENRVWQAFKNGGNSSFDYDRMGGVVRDNVRTGGNVYLDGRTVGQVISDMQGKAYRQLKRSGWQA